MLVLLRVSALSLSPSHLQHVYTAKNGIGGRVHIYQFQSFSLQSSFCHEAKHIMSEISREELDEIYAFAVQLGKDAGKMLLEAANLRMGDADGKGRQELKEHVQKVNAVDLVTETDEGES
jgi:hypothetical protein